MLCHFTNNFNVWEWGVITMILIEPYMWSLGLWRHQMKEKIISRKNVFTLNFMLKLKEGGMLDNDKKKTQ